jgi:flagellar biosynthesis/type III secretory pathway chaperone
MTAYECQQRVHELIQEEICLLDKLRDILQKEYKALNTNNDGSIRDLADHKQQIITSLETLNHQRESELEKAGYQGNKSGMKVFVKQCSEHIARDWQQLITIISECSRQNEINGIIINATSRHTALALSLLKGQQGSDNHRYGPNGESQGNTYSNPLAKA